MISLPDLKILSSCLLLLVPFGWRRVVRGDITKPLKTDSNRLQPMSFTHVKCFNFISFALLKWWVGGCISCSEFAPTSLPCKLSFTGPNPAV